METKEYFEKVMQDFNQNRRGRNLRKYCSDEGIDYKWLSEYNHVIVSLTKRMQGLLDSIPFFKDVDYICVVPSSHAFVREIVSGLKEFDFSDISSSLSWNKKQN